jgi:hypothetical protein
MTLVSRLPVSGINQPRELHLEVESLPSHSMVYTRKNDVAQGGCPLLGVASENTKMKVAFGSVRMYRHQWQPGPAHGLKCTEPLELTLVGKTATR